MNHQQLRPLGAALLAVLLLAVACGGEEASKPIPGCENAPRPIVFVHGFMGAGDSFANAAMHFSSNGYCPAFLRVFDWNTQSFDMARTDCKCPSSLSSLTWTKPFTLVAPGCLRK
jgi:hypothetical protein